MSAISAYWVEHWRNPFATTKQLISVAVILPLLLLHPVVYAQSWDWAAAPSGGPNSQITPAAFSDNLLSYAVNGAVHLWQPNGGSVGPVAQPYTTGLVHRSPVMIHLPDKITSEIRLHVFVTNDGGYLYKFDAANSVEEPLLPLQLAETSGVPQIRDMKRGACSSDTLIAEPVVQRRSDSNAQFTLSADIVIVATAHECGDTTMNQVIALDAGDITAAPLWIFNAGEYEVAGFHACQLDLSRNLVYCSAEHPDGTSQASVWAIHTTNGALAWAAIFDSGVHARLAIAPAGSPGAGHVYAGDMLGRVHILDAVAGTDLGIGTVPGISPKGIVYDVTVADGAYSGLVFAVGENGQLSAFYDDSSNLVPFWDAEYPGGERVVSSAVVVNELGKLYIGTHDGYFHQLSLASGDDEARGLLALDYSTGPTPQTPVFVYQAEDAIYRLVGAHYDPGSVSGSTLIAQYRLPCAAGSNTCDLNGVINPLILVTGFEDTSMFVWNIRKSTNEQPLGLQPCVEALCPPENGFAGDTPQPFDFDGDNKADFAVWRTGDRTWHILRSSDSGWTHTKWGQPGDVAVVADYDGDTIVDKAFWRPGDGTWQILKSSNGQQLGLLPCVESICPPENGVSSDIPQTGDFDGDAKADFVVWRSVDATWRILRSSDSGWTITEWGATGDLPVAADYDGDGVTDLALWRPADGTWHILKSSNDQQLSLEPCVESICPPENGTEGDIPQPFDFDGDSKADFAIWRPADSTWRILRSSDSGLSVTAWGIPGDKPVAADFDGDNLADLAVIH